MADRQHDDKENTDQKPKGSNENGKHDSGDDPLNEKKSTEGSDKGSLKSILVHRTQDDENIPESHNSIRTYQSSESGIYKFFRKHGKDLSQSNVSQSEVFIYMAIPPDGGYAWIIVTVAFLCQVITDGILFSIGTLLPNIASELSMTSKQSALVASTQIGAHCFAAPIGSALINKFGFRWVAACGALLASVAVLLATFSQTVAMLVICYGILCGASMGMLYVSTSLIINYYFEKYRPLVGGVASSGSGVGVMVISLLNSRLVKEFGWRNTSRVHVLLLILAGVLTITYKEVKPTKIGHFTEYVSDVDTVVSGESVEISSNQYSVFTPEISKGDPGSTGSNTRNIKRRLTYLSSIHVEPSKWTFFSSLCCYREKQASIDDNGKHYIIGHDPLDRTDIFYDGTPNYDKNAVKDLDEISDIKFLPGKEERARSISYSLSVIRPASTPLQSDTVQGDRVLDPSKIREAFYNLFDFQMFRLVEFKLLLLDAFIYPMGFNIPFVYASIRAEIHEDYSKLLPAVIGLTNIILRLLIGFLAYKIKFHTAYLSGGGVVLGGLLTLLSGFVGEKTIWFQFLFVVCFGTGVASYSALRATVYVQVLGLERLTNAFGLTTMLMGMGVFCGTNIAGMLNDYVGGYWASFVFSGICMTVSGCIKLAIPCLMKHKMHLDAKQSLKKVRFARKKWWQRSFARKL